MTYAKYTWSGQLNQQDISGTGTLLTNTENGRMHGDGEFTNYPRDVSLLVSGVSWFCVSCSNKFRTIGSAENIVSFTGGNYVATRDLVLTDINGKVIGKISLEGTAKQVDPANFNINVKIDGTFKGPTDIERVSDYWFPLTHDGKGKVVGQYVQSLFPTAGPPITLTCHLKYEWKNEKRMPFDQVVTTHFLDTSESVDRSGVRMFGVNAVAVGHKTLTYEELVGLKVGTILD